MSIEIDYLKVHPQPCSCPFCGAKKLQAASLMEAESALVELFTDSTIVSGRIAKRNFGGKSEPARRMAALAQPVIIERQGLTCRLYLGDCLDILPSLAAVDAVITDPPYGIGFASQPTTGGRARGQERETWDEEPANVSGLIRLAPIVAIWGGNYYVLPASRGWLVWYKPDAPPSMGNVELGWAKRDMNSRQISWSIAATNKERVGHPTQKPVAVMAWSMAQVGVPEGGATVLDPYMGSGTTGIACLRTGRSFIGIEQDPKHFATAVARIEREARQIQLL